jgi:hypothetical protein
VKKAKRVKKLLIWRGWMRVALGDGRLYDQHLYHTRAAAAGYSDFWSERFTIVPVEIREVCRRKSR